MISTLPRSAPLAALAVAAFASAPAARASSQDAATALLVDAADVMVNEGNTGLTEAVFTIKPKHPSGTVDYQVFARTARAGEDFEPIAAGTLSFGPGQETQTVTVKVKGDTTPECDEGFVLRLQHWFRGAPMDVAAVIRNDDPWAGTPPTCPAPLTDLTQAQPQQPPPPPDAGADVRPDAGPGRDASPDTGPRPIEDAGSNPPQSSSGCSIGPGQNAAFWPAVLLLSLLARLMIAQRRRRR